MSTAGPKDLSRYSWRALLADLITGDVAQIVSSKSKVTIRTGEGPLGMEEVEVEVEVEMEEKGDEDEVPKYISSQFVDLYIRGVSLLGL